MRVVQSIVVAICQVGLLQVWNNADLLHFGLNFRSGLWVGATGAWSGPLTVTRCRQIRSGSCHGTVIFVRFEVPAVMLLKWPAVRNVRLCCLVGSSRRFEWLYCVFRVKRFSRVTVLWSLEMSENCVLNNAGSHFAKTSTFTFLPVLFAVFHI